MLKSVASNFVSHVGSVGKNNGRCGHANCLNGGVRFYLTVDDFVAAKAPDSHRIQQFSTSSTQTVQHEPVTNNKFQQISITLRIWFGTRGSEVQILSPGPIVSKFSYLRGPRPPGVSVLK
jgi:hypothetical protein